MNDPPTALVGFGEQRDGLFCRLSMNDPPTALVGFGEQRDGLFCRRSMNADAAANCFNSLSGIVSKPLKRFNGPPEVFLLTQLKLGVNERTLPSSRRADQSTPWSLLPR